MILNESDYAYLRSIFPVMDKYFKSKEFVIHDDQYGEGEIRYTIAHNDFAIDPEARTIMAVVGHHVIGEIRAERYTDAAARFKRTAIPLLIRQNVYRDYYLFGVDGSRSTTRVLFPNGHVA